MKENNNEYQIVPGSIYLGDDRVTSDFSDSEPELSAKFSFIYKEDPHFSLMMVSSNKLSNFITLVSHDNIKQISVLAYSDVREGWINLSKFYAIPVKGKTLTFKEYADYMFTEEHVEAVKAMHLLIPTNKTQLVTSQPLNQI